MLSQAKINLAVLQKLYRHADDGGGALTPSDVANLFAAGFPIRRIEIALTELEGAGEVDREYHPHYGDEGLWQISGAGLRTVERALAVSVSFIARLDANGDPWLASEEAESATLNKKPVRAIPPSIAMPAAEVRNAQPSENTTAQKETRASNIDWTKWGTILSAVGIIVTILIWTFS